MASRRSLQGKIPPQTILQDGILFDRVKKSFRVMWFHIEPYYILLPFTQSLFNDVITRVRGVNIAQ